MQCTSDKLSFATYILSTYLGIKSKIYLPSPKYITVTTIFTPNSWDKFSPPFVEPVPTKRGKFVIKVMFLRLFFILPLLLALLPPN